MKKEKVKDALKLHLLYAAGHFLKQASGIPFRYALGDAIAVFRKSGFYILFLLLISFGFIFLNPGRDVVYMLIVDFHEGKLFAIVCLLFGIIFWSVVMEFGSRYAVYVSDNSGKSLPADRVEWRKTLQKAASVIFLIAPYAVMIISVVVCYIRLGKDNRQDLQIAFYMIIGVLLLLLYIITNIYFYQRKKHKNKGREGFFALSDEEYKYADKLYGIYNDYVFNIRKKGNFPTLKSYEIFTDHFVNIPQTKDDNFPQSEQMSDEARVPGDFILTNTNNNWPNDEAEAYGSYKWIYKIPLGFYKKLHKQLKWIAWGSIGLLVLMLICGVNCLCYQYIGAPGLAFIAFGCWCGIYTGIIYVDYGAWRSWPVSLRFLLVLLFFFSSFRHDHPVKEWGDVHTPNDATYDRPTLQGHFKDWVARYKRSDSIITCTEKKDTFNQVIFVCAEGGALRTGAYTSLLLARLQDNFKKEGIDFQRSVYAYSSVSGGSLGVCFFTAIANVDKNGDTSSYTHKADTFYKEDFLSPILGRMLLGDVLNSFSPVFIPYFDRGAALEEAWDNGYSKVDKGNNIFSSPFQASFKKNNPDQNYPAVFINTSEMETGLQCWVTNIDASKSGFALDTNRDLLHWKINRDIHYSTAIDFSSRFPFLSPAGALYPTDSKSFHYVDGGYVENTGAGTMLEILRQLDPQFKANSVRPVVIMLRFSDSKMSEGSSRHRFGNELWDVLGTIIDARDGRTNMAKAQLKNYVEDAAIKGQYIDLPLTSDGEDVPENWVLSGKSLENLKNGVDSIWDRRESNELKKLCFIVK